MPCRTHLFFHICAFHQIERESKWKSKLAFIIHKRLELATTMKMSCRKDSDNNNNSDSNKSSNHKRRQRFLWASRKMLCDFVRSFHGISKKLALLPHLPAALVPCHTLFPLFRLPIVYLSVCQSDLIFMQQSWEDWCWLAKSCCWKSFQSDLKIARFSTKSCTACLSPFNW